MSLINLIGKDTDEIRFNWVVSQLAMLRKGDRILDAGAGELKFKPYCEHLEYVSQDFGQYDGDGDGRGLQTEKWDNSEIDIVSDITKVPVQQEAFDAILRTEVFEHIPDAIAAVREFSRILKPGGTLLITAPFNSLSHFAPYHFCGYNRYWYEYHLPANGLEIEVIDHNGSWFKFIAQELRRSRFVGRKYSSGLLGLVTRVASIPLLILLTLLAKRDSGSQELLCFGFMVRARKMTSK
jgi:SAM-dependent methyltransferase